MRVHGLRVGLLAVLTVTVALAGCSDEAPKELDTELPTDAVVSDDGRDLRTDLLVTDSLPGPEWSVGDWFGHHIFFGAEDTEGTHINVIVTEDRGSDWYLVSEDPEIGMYEAIFDIPITGALSKKDLDTTAFGGVWEVYDFPMSHNKTWTGTLTMDPDYAFDLTFTATYKEDFKTMLGTRPGFLVTGVDAEGRTVLATDYVPAIGWYTDFVVFDPDDPEQIEFRSISMGTGHNWTGEYVDYSAEVLIDEEMNFFPDPATDVPLNLAALTIPESASNVVGIVYSYAAGGASLLRLADADNTVVLEQTSTHVPPANPDPAAWGGAGVGDFVVLDANPGDWHILWLGPAVASGFGAQLWTLTELPGSL